MAKLITDNLGLIREAAQSIGAALALILTVISIHKAHKQRVKLSLDVIKAQFMLTEPSAYGDGGFKIRLHVVVRNQGLDPTTIYSADFSSTVRGMASSYHLEEQQREGERIRLDANDARKITLWGGNHLLRTQLEANTLKGKLTLKHTHGRKRCSVRLSRCEHFD